VARLVRACAQALVVTAALFSTLTSTLTTPALADPGPVTAADTVGAPVPDQYIVQLQPSSPDQVPARAAQLSRRYGADTIETYQNALQGFTAHMSPSEAAALAADPSVAHVERNTVVRASTTQAVNSGTWGLDRIDQHALPLDGTFSYSGTAAGVTAYVIDTGIRATHTDFGGRVVAGADFIGGVSPPTNDCAGHGTHVAGILGGATFGVAKGVTLVAVRVLDCNGLGTIAGVIDGIDWVTANHQSGSPAVANMSIEGAFSTSLNNAVATSVADGIVYTVAAGNGAPGASPPIVGVDACGLSPASAPSALTVGATTNTDARAGFSNFGSCVDVFAPGVAIQSDFIGSDTATAVLSGTSMAAPFVAGTAARYLASHPGATPQTVASAIMSTATAGVLTDAGAGSPDALLFEGCIDASDPRAPCAAPALTLSSNTPGVAHLSWTGLLTGAPAHVDVLRGPSSGTETAVTSLPGNPSGSFDDTCLSAGTYFYRLDAGNSWGVASSNEQSVAVAAPLPPNAPASTVSPGSRSVLVQWAAPGSTCPITQYRVYRGLHANGDDASLIDTTADGTTTSFQDTGLTNGVTYYYRVTASSTAGEGAPSAMLPATPLAPVGAFVRGNDSALWWRESVNGTWGPWASLGGLITTDPSSTTNALGTWVFARGSDNALYYRLFDGTTSTWGAWTSLGGNVSSDIALASNGMKLRFFVRGADDGLYTGAFEGPTFQGWVGLGGRVVSNPAATWDGTAFRVVVHGADDGVYSGHVSTGVPWSGFAPLGGSITSDPVAILDGSNVDVLARGGDGALYLGRGAAPNLTGFSWRSLGGAVTLRPAAVQEGNGTVRVFIVGGDGQGYTIASTSDWSGGFTSLGSQVLTAAPGVASDTAADVVVARGPDTGLWSGRYSNGWSGWSGLGGGVAGAVSASALP
jgi:subtilisin family serine protease